MSQPRRPLLFAAAAALVVATLLVGWLLLAGDDEPPPGPAVTGTAPGATTTRPGPVSLDPTATGERPGPAPTTTGDGRATATDVAGPEVGPAGPAPAAPPGPTGPLLGRVVDVDGRPIPGAQVISGGWQGEELGPVVAITDAQGRFSVQDLPPTGLLEFAAERHARRVVSLEGAEGLLEVVLALARALEGRVVAAEDERPLGGVLVQGESATWRNRARTGADGRFRFEDLPAEEASFVFTCEGRVGAVASEEEAAVVRLSLGRAVRGVVLAPEGAPVAGALVLVIGAEQLGHPQSGRSDDAGRFEVSGLGPEESFAVLAFGAARGEELGSPLELSWFGPDSTEVTCVLARTRTLHVRHAPAGALLSPANSFPGVPAAPRGGVRDGAITRFEGLLPGAWLLEVAGRQVGDMIDVPVGDPLTPVVVDLPATPEAAAPRRAGTLRVRVVDEARRPLSAAMVVVSAPGREGEQAVKQTGQDGLAAFDQPPGGPLSITASLPGRVLAAPLFWDEAAGGDVELTLARPVTLEGRLQLPVAGLSGYVTLMDAEGTVLRTTQTTPEGRFKLLDLPPGPVTVEVVADGCVPIELRVELPVAGELQVTLQRMGDEHDHEGHEDH